MYKPFYDNSQFIKSQINLILCKLKPVDLSLKPFYGDMNAGDKPALSRNMMDMSLIMPGLLPIQHMYICGLNDYITTNDIENRIQQQQWVRAYMTVIKSAGLDGEESMKDAKRERAKRIHKNITGHMYISRR